MLLGWFMKNTAAKVTGGLATGGGVIILALAMHGDVTSKIEVGDANVKQYVDLRVKNVNDKLQTLKEGQTDIKSLLKTIDKRIYELKK